jgi:hypothetical protein
VVGGRRFITKFLTVPKLKKQRSLFQFNNEITQKKSSYRSKKIKKKKEEEREKEKKKKTQFTY